MKKLKTYVQPRCALVVLPKEDCIIMASGNKPGDQKGYDTLYPTDELNGTISVPKKDDENWEKLN